MSTRRVSEIIAAAAVLAVAGGGCRKRGAVRPPVRRDAGVNCPAPETLARLVHQDGRQVRTDCLVYAPKFFWLGATLSFDAGGANPRMGLIYGGQPPALFDLEPVPPDVLARIIKANQDLRISIRKPSPESRLVRVGVYGEHGGERPEAEELVLVLRLVAHAPPQILWTGSGDQVHTEPTGCITERTIDFEMPFGDRLEMTTVQRAHRRDPAVKHACIAAPSTQQTLDYQPQPLAPSRPLGKI